MIYKSYEEFERLKNELNANKAWELGEMYKDGAYIKIEKDLEKAYEYYEQAASMGHIPSMLTLGNTYASGYNHIEKNEEKALFWFKKAASLGEQYAQLKLERINRRHKNEAH